MGRDLLRAHRIYRDTLTEASDVTGTDVVALCREPDHADRLNRQENAQLCLLAASVATYRVLTVECGVRFAWCAGHSLGEYSALCSTGVLSFADGLRLVAARARLIRSVADGLDGTGDHLRPERRPASRLRRSGGRHVAARRPPRHQDRGRRRRCHRP